MRGIPPDENMNMILSSFIKTAASLPPYSPPDVQGMVAAGRDLAYNLGQSQMNQPGGLTSSLAGEAAHNEMHSRTQQQLGQYQDAIISNTRARETAIKGRLAEISSMGGKASMPDLTEAGKLQSELKSLKANANKAIKEVYTPFTAKRTLGSRLTPNVLGGGINKMKITGVKPEFHVPGGAAAPEQAKVMKMMSTRGKRLLGGGALALGAYYLLKPRPQQEYYQQQAGY